MESTTDLARTLRRARIGYEWSRIRRAFVGFLPVYLLIGAACAFGENPRSAFIVGVTLFVAGVVALWYGRDAARAVLPGLVAGMAPLVLVIGARYVGHACNGAACTSVCLWACVAGGGLAGFVVGRVGRARKAAASFFAAATLVALLTGALACVHLGGAGIAALALGYASGALPSWSRGSRGLRA